MIGTGARSKGTDYANRRARECGVVRAGTDYANRKARPNVGRLSILRKCLVRAMSPKRDGGGHTSEDRGVETYA